MPRHSNSSSALPSDADGVGYRPGTRGDWSTPEPENVQQALDNIGSSRVTGPGASTDHGIARWDGVGGYTLQDSLATISDAGHLYTPGNLQCLGILIAVGAGPHYLGPIAGATTIRIGSANETIAGDGAGTLTIAAATALILGNVGNTILGDATLRVLRPHTDEKIDLGSGSHKFNNIFCNLKTGITQVAAGAAAGELWSDTDDDNTVKLGV